MHTDLKESLRWLHGNGSAVQQYMDILSAVFKCQLVYTLKKGQITCRWCYCLLCAIFKTMHAHIPG